MEIHLIDNSGKKKSGSSMEVSSAVFDRAYNEALIHQVVTAYMANARLAARAQKDRSEVSHTTHKPWRQKGTGRARSGTTASPLWRGGGKTFPNSQDENFSHKLNRKMYRAGMCSILSELLRRERLLVVEQFVVSAPKTKLFCDQMKAVGCSGDSVMLVTEAFDENLMLSSRNLVNALVLDANSVDPVSLVHFSKVVVTKAAVKKFEEILA